MADSRPQARGGMVFGAVRPGLGRKTTDRADAVCQKCLQKGHWMFECQGKPAYVSRPSRSKQLANPKLRQPFNTDKPPERSVFQAEGKQVDDTKAKKVSKKRKGDSSSSSSSSSSDSSSSSSSSSSSDSSSSSSSESEDERPRKKQRD